MTTQVVQLSVTELQKFRIQTTLPVVSTSLRVPQNNNEKNTAYFHCTNFVIVYNVANRVLPYNNEGICLLCTGNTIKKTSGDFTDCEDDNSCDGQQ